MTDEIQVRVGVDASDAVAGMDEGEAAIVAGAEAVTAAVTHSMEESAEASEGFAAKFKESMLSAKESAESLNSSIAGIHNFVGAFSELALAGFGLEMVWENLEKVAEQAESLEHLSMVTGVSAEALSGLQGAAMLAGVSSDNSEQGFVRLARAVEAAQNPMSAQARAFEALGISAEDLKGKKMDQVLHMVADAFHNSADGAGKAAIASALFGRNVEKWIVLLDGGAEGLDKNAALAKELGAAMDENAKKKMAEFAENINLCKTAFAGLINTSMTWAVSFGEKIQQNNGYLAKSFNMMGYLATFGQRGAMPWQTEEPKEKKDEKGPAAGAPQLNYDPTEDKSGVKDRMAIWEEGDKALLRSHGAFGEQAKGIERAYWQSILDAGGLSAAEYAAIQSKLYESDNAAHEKAAGVAKRIENEKKSAIMEGYKEQETAAGKNWDQVIAIEEQALARVKELYPTDAEAWEKVEAQILEAKRKQSEQAIALKEQEVQATQTAAMSQLTFEEGLAKLAQQSSQMSKDALLAQDMQFEQRRFDIANQAAQNTKSLDSGQDPAKTAQINNQIEQLQRQHEQNMETIQAQGDAQQAADWQKTVTKMDGFFQKGLNTMLAGHTKFSTMLKQQWNQLVIAAADMVLKIVLHWAMGEEMKTAATEEGEMMRVALKLWGSVTSLAITAGEAIKEIAIRAAQAMAGAWAAISAIPYVGPFLAPAIALAAGAAVYEIGSNISAEGGYDIPAGMNPLVQTHQREMILPAPIADTVRNAMTGSSGKDGQSGGEDSQSGGSHYHYHAAPGESPNSVSKNTAAFATAGRKALRNFSKGKK